jgi:AcrR family transcriptional regulator
MASIARRVGVTPGALYKHFPGKQSLLLEVMRYQVDYLSGFEGQYLEQQDSSADVVSLAISRTCEQWEFPVLWRRESRNLTPDARREIRHRIRSIADALRKLLENEYPELGTDLELHAWAIIAIVGSHGDRRATIPRDRIESELKRAALSALSVQVATHSDRTSPNHDSYHQEHTGSTMRLIHGRACRSVARRRLRWFAGRCARGDGSRCA